MDNNIKLTQNLLAEMAQVFHRFCVSHNLTYYMLGGTLLGAVRHRGFIPWDDDMDFGMPREDYERMLTLRHKIDDGFLLRHIKTRNISDTDSVKCIMKIRHILKSHLTHILWVEYLLIFSY